MPVASRQLIRDWAHKDGQRVAVHTAEGHLTYSDLQGAIAQLASSLRSCQIQPGSQIALAFANTPEYIIWLFAIFELKAVACPIDPQLSADETRRLLERGSIDLFCGTQSEKVDGWIPLMDPAAVSGQLWCRDIERERVNVVDDEHAVLRQFTSGSTGECRHILRTELQLAEDYRHFCDHLGLQASDRFLGVAPFFHAFGALGLFACLSVGASILPVRRFMPGDLLGAAVPLQPTVFLATPPMIDLLGRCFLRDDEGKAFDSLRYCICSTGKLMPQASESFTRRFQLAVSVLYGSSETLSATIDLEDDFVENRVGKPFPGVVINIFDDNGRELGVGETGRVGVCSPASCTEYAVSDKPVPRIGDFTLPGDKGYLDTIGQLHVLGRDDCIDIGGHKVDRVEVQEVIQRIAAVTYVAVLPYQRAGQPALRAVVEADPVDVTLEMISQVCRQNLATYKIPARIDIHPELPRDTNGKVQLGRLGTSIDAADTAQ